MYAVIIIQGIVNFVYRVVRGHLTDEKSCKIAVMGGVQ